MPKQKQANSGIITIQHPLEYKELSKAQRKISELQGEFGDDKKALQKSPRYKLWETYEKQLELYISIPF